ncbi:uncharacterized protein [Amphiura filiformis]|uniref:uncharacterized protein isoform X2 n=1 Tax=Amphiura filiformis TaxID=82378 RepID=UPI003B21790C
MAAEKFLNQIRTHVFLLSVFVLIQATCVFAQGQSPGQSHGQCIAQLVRQNKGKIDGQFLVTLKADENVDVYADQHNRNHGKPERVRNKWKNGFSARLTPNTFNEICRDDKVDFIEEDGIVQKNSNWGLDRIDQKDLPLSRGTPEFIGDGAGAHIYIIDTGVHGVHNEFTGRFDEANSYDVINDEWRIGTDCDGHGTHCAGIAAGSTTGVAPRATLHSIRVLNCEGKGSYSGILDALYWLARNHKRPAVASMSLSGGSSPTVNKAISDLVAAGVVVSVAAGNENDNACYYSPASAELAITVGATDSSDNRASFSNYGSCVDIFAPGTSIFSSWTDPYEGVAPNYYHSIDGTSMACPFVSGAAALLRGLYPSMSPADVARELDYLATSNKVNDEGSGSPRSLLFIGYDINECASSPCQNGACYDDGVNGYTCTCNNGYTGTNCETNIDDCAGVTCTNGICVDQVNGYVCQCPAGFTGADCSIDIDDCVGVTCLNGGVCVDQVNGYYCQCSSGYTGADCSTAPSQCAGTTFNGYCYIYVASPSKSWTNAQTHCEGNLASGVRANLVSIHSQAEFNIVNNLGNSNNEVWIGLNDINREGTFVWSDGSATDYGRIRNRNDCVAQVRSGSGKWKTLRCSNTKSFVCKYQLSSP